MRELSLRHEPRLEVLDHFWREALGEGRERGLLLPGHLPAVLSRVLALARVRARPLRQPGTTTTNAEGP
eukprot:1063763-Alexandrium_andersonii.AAC.1